MADATTNATAHKLDMFIGIVISLSVGNYGAADASAADLHCVRAYRLRIDVVSIWKKCVVSHLLIEETWGQTGSTPIISCPARRKWGTSRLSPSFPPPEFPPRVSPEFPLVLTLTDRHVPSPEVATPH